MKARVRRLYTDGRCRFIPTPHNKVINWGCSTRPVWYRGACPLLFNHWEAVQVAANKLKTFDLLATDTNIPIPVYTTDRNTALQWVNEGIPTLGRTTLNGHSGQGIVVATNEAELPVNCPLFVQYIKKKHEYRIHIAFGKVIDVQHKRKCREYNGVVDYVVRNHHTGWVYCRDGLVRSDRAEQVAMDAVRLLGLDFGAVDIIYNQHYDAYYVLEVNTAPGLTGTTLVNYTNAFYEELTK